MLNKASFQRLLVEEKGKKYPTDDKNCSIQKREPLKEIRKNEPTIKGRRPINTYLNYIKQKESENESFKKEVNDKISISLKKKLTITEKSNGNTAGTSKAALPKSDVNKVSLKFVPKPVDKLTEPNKENIAPICVEDIDKKFEGNLFLVTTYVNDIYKYLIEREKDFKVKRDFLRDRKITVEMRGKLINWMTRIQTKNHLLSETLHLSVYLVDKYLEKSLYIREESLPLLGVSTLFVAGKYEELCPLVIKDCLDFCSGKYDKTQVKKMEQTILKIIDFKLARPPPLEFLRRYGVISQINKKIHCLSKYLLEIGIFNYKLCYERPSKVAAAALFMSLCVNNLEIKNTFWNSNLIHYTGYELSNFKHIFPIIAESVVNDNCMTLDAVRKKFSGDDQEQASKIFETSENVNIIKQLVSF